VIAVFAVGLLFHGQVELAIADQESVIRSVYSMAYSSENEHRLLVLTEERILPNMADGNRTHFGPVPVIFTLKSYEIVEGKPTTDARLLWEQRTSYIGHVRPFPTWRVSAALSSDNSTVYVIVGWRGTTVLGFDIYKVNTDLTQDVEAGPSSTEPIATWSKKFPEERSGPTNAIICALASLIDITSFIKNDLLVLFVRRSSPCYFVISYDLKQGSWSEMEIVPRTTQ